MAETKTSETAVWEQLQDITECCVCNETYRDPKVLPCIHTFCRTCLEGVGCKTGKNPGDQMPCPMCRKEFTIPEDGYAGLQKNFFMEKLLAMAKISNPVESCDHCEACMKEKRKSSSEVPLSGMTLFCADCQRKLCQECHIKHKLTQNPQVVAGADFKCEVQIAAPSNCIKHEMELDLYCSECKELVCKLCFGEEHQNHRLQSALSVVEGFKNEIKDILSGLEVCLSEVSAKNEILNCELEEYCKSLENLKLEVFAQTDAVQKLVSEHTDLLMQAIDQLKLKIGKEVNADIEDRNEDMVCLESFKVYCSKVMTKGSTIDICCTIDELKERFEDFKKMHESNIELKTSFPKISFHMSNLAELAKTGNYNIIGTLQGSQEDIFSEAEAETTDRISCDGHIKLDDDCRKSISGNDDMQVKINHLEQELENERRRIRRLELEKKAFEKRIGELELCMKIPLKSTSKYSLDSQTPQPLARQVHPRRGVSINYKQTPDLVKTLQRGDPSLNGGRIVGLAVVDDELFVGFYTDISDFSVIAVYDIETLNFRRRWQVRSRFTKSLVSISCLASCTRYKFMYARISIYGKPQFSISRTCLNGSVAKEWRIKGATGHSSFSVTDEGSVLVINDGKSLVEYSIDGVLVHEVTFLWKMGIQFPLHALKLDDGDFVVSHGLGNNRLNRVLILSGSGQIKKAFGMMPLSDTPFCQEKRLQQVYEPKLLNEPIFLNTDGYGKILVADNGNNRIVVLNSDLGFECEISPIQHLDKPTCMVIDAGRRRLFVCEGMKKVSVFDFSC